MNKQSSLLWLALGIMTARAGAQVTTDGSTLLNTVPYFKNSTTQLSSSPITMSGGNVGIGTNTPQGALDLGVGTWGRALIWGGPSGSSNWYASIGTSYSSSSPGILSMLKFDTTADRYLYSYGATAEPVPVSGLRFDANSGDIMFFNAAPAQNYTVGNPFDYVTNTKFTIKASGNVGIGTTAPGTTDPNAKLEVNGGDIVLTYNPSRPKAIVFSDGTNQQTAWTGVLCGGDYAEAVDPAGGLHSYGSGDVLVITDNDAGGDVRKSSEPYSTMVAGIYATKPGVVGRRESLPKDAQDLPMAMVGIVPTKVTAENGPIHRGDLLVTSSIPGYAMKGTDRNRLVGAVIGKAMGSLERDEGVIEVLVTLQ